MSRQTHKIDADGRDVALGVCVVGKTEEQARLSDTRVSDEEELEEVVVSVVPRSVSGLFVRSWTAGHGEHSVTTQVSMALHPGASSLFVGLWRWASHGGYVPLGVHGCGRYRGYGKSKD